MVLQHIIVTTVDNTTMYSRTHLPCYGFGSCFGPGEHASGYHVELCLLSQVKGNLNQATAGVSSTVGQAISQLTDTTKAATSAVSDTISSGQAAVQQTLDSVSAQVTAVTTQVGCLLGNVAISSASC